MTRRCPEFRLFVLGVLVISGLFTEARCQADHDHDHDSHGAKAKDLSTSQQWAFGLLTTFGISFLELITCVIIVYLIRVRKVSNQTLNLVVLILVSFAVGALVGDAVLHMLPGLYGKGKFNSEKLEEVLTEVKEGLEGLNQNSTIGVSQEKIISILDAQLHKQVPTDYNLLYSLLIIGGIVAFIFIDKILEKFGASHSHGGQIQVENYHNPNEHHHHHHHHGTGTDGEAGLSPQNGKIGKAEAPTQIGWLNIISSLIHNGMDGITIGIAFASGDKSVALATAVAVLAHEIPREIGDTGILLAAGFAGKKIIFWNTFVNITAIIGTIIALPLGSVNEVVTNCFIAIVAGNFFYIALTSMLPVVNSVNTFKIALGQLIALGLGVGAMVAVIFVEGTQGHDH